MKKTLIPTIALGAMILASGQAQAAELVRIIDSFNIDQSGTTPTGTPNPRNFTTSGQSITSPLLGSVIRILSGSKTSGANAQTIAVNVDSSDSTFSFVTGTNIQGSGTSNYGTFSPTDFTVGGADRILANVISSDASLLLSFNFTDSDGTTGVLSVLTPGGPFEVSLPFSTVGSVSGGNAILNFNAITAFNFRANTTAVGSPDLSLDFVGVGKTPEPSAVLGLSSLGLLGLMTRKRKKKES